MTRVNGITEITRMIGGLACVVTVDGQVFQPSHH